MEALPILLPRKPEGQPHTYNTGRLTLCLTYRLTQVWHTSHMRITTETQYTHNTIHLKSANKLNHNLVDRKKVIQ